MNERKFHVVLVEPEIPPNTGNIARLCAVTGSMLHLVGPLGFQLGDRELKRAGMDYWRQVEFKIWSHWTEFCGALPAGSRTWMIEAGGPKRYDQASFAWGDWLIFGRETLGLPEELLRGHRDRWLRVPMRHPEARSLNLSNCAALVLFEALRQQGFADCDHLRTNH
ncbi:MAG: tRNA (cytidine(34)-2'-O)-methyltransferase [Verrucomicrobia bacterium]|nr:tRNA (cytidine(34)-2'-O)-methyltransferase [Verrucomicrobiota bacterium]